MGTVNSLHRPWLHCCTSRRGTTCGTCGRTCWAWRPGRIPLHLRHYRSDPTTWANHSKYSNPAKRGENRGFQWSVTIVTPNSTIHKAVGLAAHGRSTGLPAIIPKISKEAAVQNALQRLFCNTAGCTAALWIARQIERPPVQNGNLT